MRRVLVECWRLVQVSGRFSSRSKDLPANLTSFGVRRRSKTANLFTENDGERCVSEGGTCDCRRLKSGRTLTGSGFFDAVVEVRSHDEW